MISAVTKWWRPPVLGLAAVVFCAAEAAAQSMPLGERLQQCGVCHGEDGNSKMENIPSLAGQPAFFTLNQLFLMREGVRKVEAMAPIVKELKDADLQALSEHYAKLEPKRSSEPIDPALVKRGAEIAAQRRCGSCHLANFAGVDQMPRLARQRIDFTFMTLKAYRDNPRPGADTAMSVNVAGASDDDLLALAHYGASL